MKFWDLPLLVAVRVLTEWLEMKEVGKIDSATVNQTKRHFLLNLYKSQSAVFMGISETNIYTLLTDDSYFVWIWRRGISVRTLAVIHCATNLRNIFAILGDGPFPRTLKLIIDKAMFSVDTELTSSTIVRLGQLFPNVERLEFHNCDVNDNASSRTVVLASGVSIFPHLQRLIVEKCAMHETSLPMILMKGVNIHNLELNAVNFVDKTRSATTSSISTTDLMKQVQTSCTSLVSVSTSCPNLSILALRNLPVPSLVFGSITSHCKLTDIHLAECDVWDEWFVSIANNCNTILRNLRVDKFILTDPSTMVKLAEKCTELEHIRFRQAICQDICRIIPSCDVVSTHCTKLVTFEIHCTSGVLFSEVGLHSLLTNCKQIETIIVTDIQKGSVPSRSVQPSTVIPCLALQTVNLLVGHRRRGELKLTAQTMRFLADSAPNLTDLSINNRKETDDDTIMYIANRCKKLQILDLFHCNQLSTRAVTALAMNCRDLHSLEIRRTYGATIVDVQKVITACRNLVCLCWSYKGTEPTAAIEKLKKKHPKVQLFCESLPQT